MSNTDTFQFYGTISHGTLRPADLIRTFFQTIEVIDYEVAQELYMDYLSDTRTTDDVDADILEDLFNALDAASPDGYYFGSTESDGSDFGFWPVDNL